MHTSFLCVFVLCVLLSLYHHIIPSILAFQLRSFPLPRNKPLMSSPRCSSSSPWLLNEQIVFAYYSFLFKIINVPITYASSVLPCLRSSKTSFTVIVYCLCLIIPFDVLPRSFCNLNALIVWQINPIPALRDSWYPLSLFTDKVIVGNDLPILIKHAKLRQFISIL